MRTYISLFAFAAIAFASAIRRDFDPSAVASASAAASSVAAAAAESYTPPPPMGDMSKLDWNKFFECRCPKDNTGDTGVHINQADWWYQCAYPNGACQWSVVSACVFVTNPVANMAFLHSHSSDICTTRNRRTVQNSRFA
jgi:hypothetical protein